MQNHHSIYEIKKFKMRDHEKSNITAPELAKELTLKRCRLLPFTINHHWIIGPMAMDYLFDQNQINVNDYIKNSQHEDIKKLIQT